jgi:hypothetical protein
LEVVDRGDDADEGPSKADVAKRQLIEQMYAAGDISEQEYDEMVSRMESGREQAEKDRAKEEAWKEVVATFNEKSSKRGVAMLEREWNSLGVGEPFSACAVARILRGSLGPPTIELSRSEIGEFLAGGKPFMIGACWLPTRRHPPPPPLLHAEHLRVRGDGSQSELTAIYLRFHTFPPP